MTDENKLRKRVSRIEEKLIEQEHRLIPMFRNLIQHGFRKPQSKSDSKRRKVAWIAFVQVIFFSRNSVAVISSLSLTAIIGLYLAFKANKLVEKQNELITNQNFLIESERRSALIFELSSILDEMDEEIDYLEEQTLKQFGVNRYGFLNRVKSQMGGSTDQDNIDMLASMSERINDTLNDHGMNISVYPFTSKAYVQFTLSPLLEGRIISLNKAFRPYRYLDLDGKLITDPISPERSQLLISLIESDVNIESLLRKGDFSFCEFNGTQFVRAYKDYSSDVVNLEGINLTNSKFVDSRMFLAFLDNALMNNCEIRSTDFINSSLFYCDFNGSRLTNATFENSSLNSAMFFYAVLTSVEFAFCDLTDAEFTYSKLNNVSFSNTLLPDKFGKEIKTKNVDFETAIVSTSNYFINNPTFDWSNYKLERMDVEIFEYNSFLDKEEEYYQIMKK